MVMVDAVQRIERLAVPVVVAGGCSGHELVLVDGALVARRGTAALVAVPLRGLVDVAHHGLVRGQRRGTS